ncbi:MAG: hypothetical protein ACJ78G_00630 [Gemmatimonadaceae bacterium]
MRSPNATLELHALAPRRKRRFIFLKAAFAVVAAAFGVLVGLRLTFFASVEGKTGTPHSRETLFALLQPVALSNCELQRFGEAHDGGYLMCANLLQDVQAGYSYGISGYDQWGCDVSTRRKVPVHQYDCFNTTVPACPAGHTNFHAECVGDVSATRDGRLFDTIANQLQKNGDASKRIVLKIDVEGAEWSSFLAAPDETLLQIDQLAVEFHGIEDQQSVAVVQRLKKFFEVAHIHYNNASCLDAMAPFPSWAYEVLFVSKRLAVVDPSRKLSGVHPLDARNIPFYRDCQATP